MHEANEELGRYEPNWRLFGERQPATWFSSFQVVLEDDGMLVKGAETTDFLSERTGARNNEATNCFDLTLSHPVESENMIPALGRLSATSPVIFLCNQTFQFSRSLCHWVGKRKNKNKKETPEEPS